MELIKVILIVKIIDVSKLIKDEYKEIYQY